MISQTTNTGHKDYCTLWPDGVWSHCCQAHDRAYAIGVNKLDADVALAQCVAATGNDDMGIIMLLGVLIFGGIPYLIAQWRRVRRGDLRQ
jgi:hypothetical protein